MKLDFHKKARDQVEAIGAVGTIKKHNCALLKLPKLPKLGKLEAHDTSPLISLPYCHLQTK